jgi:3-phosphoshikimate 1-carboxyvinyltransferase
VREWLPAGDTRATLQAMRQMGVTIAVGERSAYAWDLEITGRGLRGLQQPAAPINCANAGTCLRLLAGMLAGQRFPSSLDGSEQLRRRPMRRIVAPLNEMGARIESEKGTAPLHIRPGELRGMTYELPIASAQVKSALLLAGLYARGRTDEPGPARDHTERMLQAMGVAVEVHGRRIALTGLGDSGALAPLHLTVPGDISSAAFPLVAAALIPGSQVTVEGVGVNGTRLGLVDLLEAMGADLTLSLRDRVGGEPVGDLAVPGGALRGAHAAGDVVVRAIDELPLWAVAASQAHGASTLRDAAELRVKEVDRIGALLGELGRLGVGRGDGGRLEERRDGFTLAGPFRLRGAEVDSHGDHRLAMALAIAGLFATGPTLVRNAGCIADSFPGFVETMRELGARMEWSTGS